MFSYRVIFALISTIFCSVELVIAAENVFTVDGNSTNSYLRILHIEESFILVGGRKYLYNIDTQSMTLNTKHEWVPSAEDADYCYGEINKFKDCNSYVRSAIRMSDSSFRVCASSAKQPSCRKLLLINETWTLTAEVINDALTPSLSPLLPWNDIVVFKTSNTGVLYVVTHLLEHGAVWVPFFFRDNMLDGNGSVIRPGLRTSKHGFDVLFQIDYFNERGPEFKSLFETDSYVYLMYSEPARETLYSLGAEQVVYSRIARVCKNDKGRGHDPNDGNSEFLFATLYKARLICGHTGIKERRSSSYITRSFSGYYRTNIEVLADSSEPHPSSFLEGEKIVFAIFNSPKSSTRSSAICAYKISSINDVFSSRFLSRYNGANIFNGYDRVESTRPAAQCYQNSSNQTSKTKPFLNDYLLFHPIYPIDNQTLFFNPLGYRMTQMVVEWQVNDLQGNKHEVVFVSTDDGRLLKLVSFQKIGDLKEKFHLVEERTIFNGEAVKEMKLIVDEAGEKHLLLNNMKEIERVPLAVCSIYTTCTVCVGLQDPYCAWSPSILECVPITHGVTDKYQNVTTGKSTTCDNEVIKGAIDSVSDNFLIIEGSPTTITCSGKLIKQEILLFRAKEDTAFIASVVDLTSKITPILTKHFSTLLSSEISNTSFTHPPYRNFTITYHIPKTAYEDAGTYICELGTELVKFTVAVRGKPKDLNVEVADTTNNVANIMLKAYSEVDMIFNVDLNYTDPSGSPANMKKSITKTATPSSPDVEVMHTLTLPEFDTVYSMVVEASNQYGEISSPNLEIKILPGHPKNLNVQLVNISGSVVVFELKVYSIEDVTFTISLNYTEASGEIQTVTSTTVGKFVESSPHVKKEFALTLPQNKTAYIVQVEATNSHGTSIPTSLGFSSFPVGLELLQAAGHQLGVTFSLYLLPLISTLISFWCLLNQ